GLGVAVVGAGDLEAGAGVDGGAVDEGDAACAAVGAEAIFGKRLHVARDDEEAAVAVLGDGAEAEVGQRAGRLAEHVGGGADDAFGVAVFEADVVGGVDAF